MYWQIFFVMLLHMFLNCMLLSFHSVSVLHSALWGLNPSSQLTWFQQELHALGTLCKTGILLKKTPTPNQPTKPQTTQQLVCLGNKQFPTAMRSFSSQPLCCRHHEEISQSCTDPMCLLACSWWFSPGPRATGSGCQPPPTHSALAIASGLLALTACQLNQDAYLSNHTHIFPHKRLLLGNASVFNIPVTLME